jgi:hypothetical protein
MIAGPLLRDRSEAMDNCPASLAAISRNILLTGDFGS